MVLGGGGAAGLAHHVGTLLALDHDLGWKPDQLLHGDRAARVLAASFVGASEQFGTGLRDALQAETAPAAR